ncbi:MAG: diguanylate cyclase [Oscillospiraceae bacterium]|nr:diguanylate cyclase [Oscillospiraceae bacterium]
MKIQLKLTAVMLLMILIPVIVINAISSNIINEYCMDIQIASSERSIKNQADNINLVCESTITQAKELAIKESVRDYIIASGENGYKFDENDPLYQDVMMHLNNINTYGESLINAMIVDQAGIVLASTSGKDDIGRRISNYKSLFEMSLENNGFSGFFMSGENDGQSPVYYIAKSVYSKQNERIGIFYAVYDTALIQKYINGMKLDKYTVVAIMDSEGIVLEYPYRNLKQYSANENYSAYSEQLKAIVDGSGTEKYLDATYNVGEHANERSFFVSGISNTGWYVISSTDVYGLKTSIDDKAHYIRNISICIVIVLSTLAVLYVMMFVRPVSDIMRVFSEKQKGNTSASFRVDSKDEFSEIGHAFNSMFDNIFESEQRYRTIVEMTNNITFEINFDKEIVFVSKNFNKKFSFRPKDDTLKESFLYKLRFHKDDRQRYLNDLEKILEKGSFWQGEYRVKSIYGDFIWVMIKGTKFFDRYERPTKIIGVIVDIDREKKSEMHLIQKASYDNLTQLYNRETFLKSLTSELEISAMKKSLDAVMFIDLDDFKYFNDEFGHACGDEVLKFTADTIKEISFERGFAGRFGGDEFVVCLTGLTLYGDAGKSAQEIIDILGKGFISESTGEKLCIHCSIGIAFLRESGRTTEEIVAAADEAMYNIKKHGKSAYAYAKSKNEGETVTVTELAPTTSEIDSDTEPVVIGEEPDVTEEAPAAEEKTADVK